MTCDQEPYRRVPGGATVDPVIEVFADVRCPFAHVGLRRLADLRDELRPDAVMLIRAWPLEWVNDAPLDVDHVAENVAALRDSVASDLFAGFDARTFASTSIPAMSLTSAAYDLGPEIGELVALTLRAAQFEQGLDIASPAVLLDIAHSVGMELPQRGGRPGVEADWHEGARRGVIGSPHFFIGASNFFCPTLDISRVGGRLHVAFDRDAFESFAGRALAA